MRWRARPSRRSLRRMPTKFHIRRRISSHFCDLRCAVQRASRTRSILPQHIAWLLAAPNVLLEASGGVTLDTVRAIALSGVDRISIGAITLSAPALDIGLDMQ